MAEGNIWEIIPRLVQRVYLDLEPEMRKTEPTVYADFQVTDIFRFSQPQSSVCCSLFGSFAKIWVQWLLKQMVRKKYEALMNMTALCSFVSEEHMGCVNGMIMVEQEQCLDLLWRIYRTSFRFTSFSAFGFYSLATWGGGGKKKSPTANLTDHTGGPFVLCLRSLFLDTDDWLHEVMEDLWALMWMLNILTPRISHRRKTQTHLFFILI